MESRLIEPVSIAPLCSWESLPRARLQPRGAVTAAFMERGLLNVQEAGHLLKSLPYGRVASDQNLLCVLTEGRGTCSTKHALLARLAADQELTIRLTLGIYEMSQENTPGVGEVLDAFDLPFILEAHCYLTFGGERIDVTRDLTLPADPIARLFHEEPISPGQVGAYKQDLHQRVLCEWSATRPEQTHGYSPEQLWEIREACIAALAQ